LVIAGFLPAEGAPVGVLTVAVGVAPLPFGVGEALPAAAQATSVSKKLSTIKTRKYETVDPLRIRFPFGFKTEVPEPK
jgi:hypothetical protein